MYENQKKKFICLNDADIEKEELKEGMIICGRVKSIQPYGAFIQTKDGSVGLLHVKNMSVARIKSASERLKIGQNVKVVVKSIDENTGKIAFSCKELLGSWQENVQQFNEGDIVTGIARETEKNKNGIFIELKPNLVGLAEYKPNIEYGQDVIVNIKKIIPEKKKIKLTII